MMRRLLTTLTAVLLATATAACVDAPVDTSEVSEAASWGDTSIRPSFELWKSSDSQFRFHMLDSRGEILVTSQGYSARTAALTGLLSVLANGGDKSHYDVRPNAGGGAYFNLKAGNGAIIATSQSHATMAAAQADADATLAAVGAYRAAWSTATGRRFALHLDAGGKYYWNLHAGNGEIVLRSQRYDSEAAALNGAFSVVDNGLTAARYEVLPSSNNGYYLNLTATNGQIIGTSEVYASKSNAERARDSIIALLPTIELL
ncbi:MAG: YegP family protein [Myxococcales bacterium]|nr:YegP family protein [Myxococcales bacterium]